MPKSIVLLLAACAALAQGQAQKKPITLDSLTEAQRRAPGAMPLPSTWTPDGKLGLVINERRLALYDPSERRSRDIGSTGEMEAAAVSGEREDAPYSWQNRRTKSAGAQFLPSGKELLFATGGDLFIVEVSNGKWRQLTRTAEAEEDPKLSPDGTKAAFRRDWDLYTIDIASGRETRLTRGGSEALRNGGLDWVYPEELELGTAYWWSPDSKSIAYLQFDVSREPLFPHSDLLRTRALYEPQRYPQAGENNADVRLGVAPAVGGPTRWLELGDTRHSRLIARAGWMPDSRSVYVIRLNRIQNELEMLATEASSGETRVVFRESDPYWINVSDDVVFLKDGKRFLWTSERDGFRHIYLYSIDGREKKQLTKGAWEVKGIAAVDEAAGRIFYTSSEATHLERHLYSIRLDGGGKRRLTTEPGTHSIAMSPTGAWYFDTWSSLQSPSRTVLHSGNGAELGMYREPSLSPANEYDVLPTEIVPFKGADGTVLYARLIKPAGFQPGRKYPVIVSVYGGPGVTLPIRNAWPGINIDQVYAHSGFVVWEAENRGGQGRGHAFETPISRNLGAVELADQVAGVQHLISLGFADPARIGIHGWSYGGFMTVNAMLNAPGVFRCGIAGAPVTDWMNYDSIYTERYMGLPEDNRDGYAKTALPPRASNLKGRLMLVQNYEDDNVLFQNMLQLTDGLQQAGKIFDFMLYPQKTHGVTGKVARQMDAAMLEFFEKNLK
jgi:dipeptidyl-peptidase-4